MDPLTEQLMDEINAMHAQRLANQTGKSIYAHALFDVPNEHMLTQPALTTRKPSAQSFGEMLRVVILAARPEN